MIVTIISSLLLVAWLTASVVLAVSLLRRPPLAAAAASWLTKSELGEFEERLSGLDEVILVADEITVPSQDNAKEMLLALIDNFSEKVRYNFIVPAAYAAKNGERIVARYNAIIDLATEFSGKSLPHSLFALHSRPVARQQKDYPYIFYRFVGEENKSEIVAFRGEDEGVGIADQYRRLEPEIARSFLFSVLEYLGTSDEPIETADYAAFAPEGHIIKFTPRKEGVLQNESEETIPRAGS